MSARRNKDRGLQGGLYKDGYEGARPGAALSLKEARTVAEQAGPLVERLHRAMLCLTVSGAAGPMGGRSNMPAFVREAADLEPEAEGPPKRFDPEPAAVADMLPALSLLEGLRRVYFRAVMVRALGEFEGGVSWAEVGDRIGLSASGAQSAYNAAVVHAARRAGVLAAAPAEYAVLVATVIVAGGARTCMATAADPRNALASIRARNAADVIDALAIWVAGKPVAERLVEVVKGRLRPRAHHAGWFVTGIEDVHDLLVGAAQEMGAVWTAEDLPGVVRQHAA